MSKSEEMTEKESYSSYALEINKKEKQCTKSARGEMSI